MIYLGFLVLELSKLLMYETYHDNFQPYIEQDNSQVLYMDCDSFVLSYRTQNKKNDLGNLAAIIDFSNTNKKPELLSKKI